MRSYIGGVMINQRGITKIYSESRKLSSAVHLALFLSLISITLVLALVSQSFAAPETPKVENVEVQPLAAQVKRLVEAMDYLGEPFSPADKQALERAAGDEYGARAITGIQEVLDKRCLVYVDINPESRVKVAQGQAEATLVERGWRTFLVKVRNEAGVTAQLKAGSPQAMTVYERSKDFVSSPSPPQTVKQSDVINRWLDLAMFDKPPLQPRLSGLCDQWER